MYEIANPLVSIVIPVFNGENFLREAIDSALKQSYKNIEIIVVNDGSTDNSEKIALSFDDKIKYFSKPNGGVSTALNLAIENMKGSYFSWLSHDDIYYPEKIEKQVSYILTCPNNTIVYSNEDKINENGLIIKKAIKFKPLKNTLVFELLHNRFIGGCSLLIPKIAFDEVGLFDESLKAIQDYDLWFRMLKQNFSFKYLPIVSGSSRIHKNQVSSLQSNMCFEENIIAFKRIINYLPIHLITGDSLSPSNAFYSLAYKYKILGSIELSVFCLEKGDFLMTDSIKKTKKCNILRLKAKMYNKYFNVFSYFNWIIKKLLIKFNFDY